MIVGIHDVRRNFTAEQASVATRIDQKLAAAETTATGMQTLIVDFSTRLDKQSEDTRQCKINVDCITERLNDPAVHAPIGDRIQKLEADFADRPRCLQM